MSLLRSLHRTAPPRRESPRAGCRSSEALVGGLVGGVTPVDLVGAADRATRGGAGLPGAGAGAARGRWTGAGGARRSQRQALLGDRLDDDRCAHDLPREALEQLGDALLGLGVIHPAV